MATLYPSDLLVTIARPLDAKINVASIAERNAIASAHRYRGMEVTVQNDGTNQTRKYWLPTSNLTNTGWVEIEINASGGDLTLPNWKSITSYLLYEPAVYDGILYRANTAHTSGITFAADIAKWDVIGGDGGTVNKKFLEIIDDFTEEEFWEEYLAGNIENGLYQYLMEVLGLVRFGDASFALANSPMYQWDRYANYVETADKYFFGNQDTQSESSRMIMMNKDGTNMTQLNVRAPGVTTITYSYQGRYAGTIGIDINGNIYCSSQDPTSSNGAILSLDSNDPLNDSLYNSMLVNTAMYIFNNISYNGMSSDITTLCVGDSFAVEDGGIFAVNNTNMQWSNQPVIYFKNREEAARSVGTYTFMAHFCGVDKMDSKFYVYDQNTNNLHKFDTSCNVTSYPVSPLPSNESIVNSSRLYVRNGKVWLCFFTYNYSNNSRNIYNYVFDTNSTTWAYNAVRWSGIPAGFTNGISSSSDFIEVNNSLIISVFFENSINYLKWDYTNNLFSHKNIMATLAYGDFSHFDLDEDGNILRTYKSLDSKAVVEVINPNDFTSFSYVSIRDVNLRAFTTIKMTNGYYYSLSYEQNTGEVIIVDDFGNVEIAMLTSAQGAGLIPIRPILSEHGTFVVLNPSYRGNIIQSIFDTLERAVSTTINNTGSLANSMPFIQIDKTNKAKGFIYSNWLQLSRFVEGMSPVSKFVSAARIILNSGSRP